MQQATQRQGRVNLDPNRGRTPSSDFPLFRGHCARRARFPRASLLGARPFPRLLGRRRDVVQQQRGLQWRQTQAPPESVAESFRYGSKQRRGGMRRWQQSRFFDDAFRDRHAGIGEPHGGVIGFRSDGPPNALGKLGQRVAEQLRDIALPARSGRREGMRGITRFLDEPCGRSAPTQAPGVIRQQPGVAR